MFETILASIGGLVIVYVILLAALWIYAHKNPDTVSLRDALRLVPDLLTLVGGLLRDRSLKVRIRVAVGALLLYLLCPIDLVPDFIPVVGYADDAVIIALILRYVIRVSGREALYRNWTGSSAGLIVIEKLCGLQPITEGT